MFNFHDLCKLAFAFLVTSAVISFSARANAGGGVLSQETRALSHQSQAMQQPFETAVGAIRPPAVSASDPGVLAYGRHGAVSPPGVWVIDPRIAVSHRGVFAMTSGYDASEPTGGLGQSRVVIVTPRRAVYDPAVAERAPRLLSANHVNETGDLVSVTADRESVPADRDFEAAIRVSEAGDRVREGANERKEPPDQAMEPVDRSRESANRDCEASNRDLEAPNRDFAAAVGRSEMSNRDCEGADHDYELADRLKVSADRV